MCMVSLVLYIRLQLLNYIRQLAALPFSIPSCLMPAMEASISLVVDILPAIFLCCLYYPLFFSSVSAFLPSVTVC